MEEVRRLLASARLLMAEYGLSEADLKVERSAPDAVQSRGYKLPAELRKQILDSAPGSGAGSSKRALVPGVDATGAQGAGDAPQSRSYELPVELRTQILDAAPGSGAGSSKNSLVPSVEATGAQRADDAAQSPSYELPVFLQKQILDAAPGGGAGSSKNALAPTVDATGSQGADWQSRCRAVRADFEARGVVVADWALANGFQPNAVYQVLGGYVQAMRGNGHRIAVALGIKPQPPK
ncbi:hypothetical protein [Roseateles chitosanitabidus]|uniref:hypothetical protein n=1 Tax=Roseateles chitosanitabidus TaxID=65048 RepID=UPI001FE00FED|nr:hypothetical protein [Roseateles chitosanitabidus]